MGDWFDTYDNVVAFARVLIDCGGANPATEPHTCPYREEIKDDYETTCTCCSFCTRECAYDV